MGTHSGHITRGQRWAALRALVLSRDRHTCQHCGRHGRLEVDHVQPVRTHPELAYAASNLQALCARCHTNKTNEETGRVQVSDDRQKWRAAVAELMRPSRGRARKDKTCSIQ